MSQANRFPAWVRLAVGFAVCAFSAAASAQPTSGRPASIIIFPKVIANSGYDTTIQITNTSDIQRYARCIYTDAEPSTPGVPSAPICNEVDFLITLTAQQPTFWVASQGRKPSDGIPGISPWVPPVSSDDFMGALLCVETDSSGNPQSGNDLIGIATLKNLTSGDVSKYSAVGLRGFNTNNGDNVLCLGGSVAVECPNGAEYEGCPQYWWLDHYADQATDDLAGAGSSVKTQLTVIPCTRNFDTQVVPSAVPQFLVENEMEEGLTASTTVSCWGNMTLSSINPAFDVAFLGTTHAQTRIGTPTEAPFSSGIIVMAQEFHQPPGTGILAPPSGSAAVDVQAQGLHPGGDIIVLPTLLP